MQAVVVEEASANSYDDLFPALPDNSSSTNIMTPAPSMRVHRSVVTQVFSVPYEERKLDSEKFGEGESWRTCQYIMKDTGAHIEISSGKDKSLTFLVTGKSNEVLEARRKILIHFQTQASKQVTIPKEHHRVILGKKGERLRDLERTTATKINVPNISEESDIITISGTKEGIEKAEHEIRTMSDEQSKKAKEKISVPKIYHPFIVGPFSENLNKLIEETGARINIPPQSIIKDEIIITGEKDGVFAARSKIELIFKDMEKKCTTVCVEVPKSQHKYVIGSRGSTIQEILRLTGVSVEMPSSDSKTDTITLRGPQETLGIALSKVYEKANSVSTVVIDAPAWIHKFIIGRKGANIKELSAEYQSNVEFLDNKIRIEAPPECVDQIKDRIVNDYLSKLDCVDMTVNPIHYKHIIGKAGANINRLKDELEVMISIEEKDGVNRIRIEGPIEGVHKAQIELDEQIRKLENEKENSINIDRFVLRLLRSHENIRELKERYHQVQIILPGPTDDVDSIKLRGPRDEVDKVFKYLSKIVDDLKEQSYVLEVPINKQSHKFIIGKGGANIKKIRDETQTTIDLPPEGDTNDVIRITGKKENVIEASERIKKINNELEDTVTEEITIPPKYYNSIIGTRGKLISAIMDECGGVSIKFPTSDSKSDKVTIRGQKEGVEKAKAQLIELSNERELSSFTAEVRAKQQQHKFLIGKNGTSIKKLRDSTGARIIFPSSNDEDKELIIIIGKKESVEAAKQELETIIKENENITEGEMNVDPKHHKYFVARRGEILHRISDDCGGVAISFPRPDSGSSRVTLKGPKDGIEAAKVRIAEFANELENKVTIECVIPKRFHGLVMGPKGSKVQAITSEYNVQIKFPDRAAVETVEEINGDDNNIQSGPPQCDVIKISGLNSKCEAAKDALLKLIPVSDEIEVPFDLHRLLRGQKSNYINDLKNNYDTRIEFPQREHPGDFIKITGTAENVEQVKQAIEERVKELIIRVEEERIDNELKSFELQFEVDPDYHPKIIGRRGQSINKIRADHGVQITFPKKEDSDANLITIKGYQSAANAAKDDIMKIVTELDCLFKEIVNIDERVHPRIIGSKGRNIQQIKNDYTVDIKFPRAGDPDLTAVTISGDKEDNVLSAKDHLLSLEEEFLNDVTNNYIVPTQTNVFSDVFEEVSSARNNGQTPTRMGFVVQGAPWERGAPNTESHEDFPDFGTAPPVVEPPMSSVWGPRR
jgi:predicted PilT family ATPase